MSLLGSDPMINHCKEIVYQPRIPKFSKEDFDFMKEFTEERDPSGLAPSEAGAKLDQGKIMASLLLDMGDALLAVAEVGTIGAKKYSRGGWMSVEDGYNRYTDAMMRHLLTKEEFDLGEGGTGLLHDAQVAWNALARLQFRLEGKV